MSWQTLTGACLCGRVSYSVTTVIEQFFLCHCEQCRRLTGSAFAANIQAQPADIEWCSGAECVRRFDWPGERQFTKVFCGECGSGLPFLNKNRSHLYIPAGSLDGDPGVAPGFNIFWAEHAHWYEAGTDAPRCQGFEP